MDRGGGLHEDVVKTSDFMTDKAVIVEESGDNELEVIVTLDKSDKLDVGDVLVSEESSGADVLTLFSPCGGKECKTLAEVVKVEKIVTTGSIRLIFAAEKHRVRANNRRARKEGNEIIGVGFAHISNAAYQTRDLGAIPPPRQPRKHTSGFQA